MMQYNPSDEPLRRLNSMIWYITKRLPYKRRVRHMIISKLTGVEGFRSTKELPRTTVERALDLYYPDWRSPVPDSIPEKTGKLIRRMANDYSRQFVDELGEPPK